MPRQGHPSLLEYSPLIDLDKVCTIRRQINVLKALPSSGAVNKIVQPVIEVDHIILACKTKIKTISPQQKKN